MREFNPQLWFGIRKVTIIPRHFIRATTASTEESIQWVEDKLTGRYGTVSESNMSGATNIYTISYHESIYFEDSKDLMMYELYWSGKNNF